MASEGDLKWTPSSADGEASIRTNRSLRRRGRGARRENELMGLQSRSDEADVRILKEGRFRFRRVLSLDSLEHYSDV